MDYPCAHARRGRSFSRCSMGPFHILKGGGRGRKNNAASICKLALFRACFVQNCQKFLGTLNG